MRTTLLLPLIAAGLAQVAAAQADTYDIASFAAPRGFRRLPSNGASLAFDDSVPHNGRPAELCQIVLFPSKPATGNPLQNFQSEWEEKIIRAQAGTTRPQPQSSPVGNGWTAMAATADIRLGNTLLHHLLIATSGFGRVMSVEIIASGGAHQPQIQEFLKSLHFRADSSGPGQISQNPNRGNPGGFGGAVAPSASGVTDPSTAYASSGASSGTSAGTSSASSMSGGGYKFTPPPGWTRGQGNGTVIVSPVYSNGERCQISMLPMRPAGRSVVDDALNIFRQSFQADPLSGYPSPNPKLTHGVSPQGWEYFILKKDIGEEGNSRTLGTVTMTARVGNQLAVIIGTSRDFLISNCFGESIRDFWPPFFYSLQLGTGQVAPDQQTAIQQRLAGSWTMATGGVGLGYDFHADGRYMSVGAAQQRTLISPTEVLATTQAYFGDGAYSFDGNRIVLKGDTGRSSTKLFRLGEESRDAGKTWKPQMCLWDEGASGEVCYRKE